MASSGHKQHKATREKDANTKDCFIANIYIILYYSILFYIILYYLFYSSRVVLVTQNPLVDLGPWLLPGLFRFFTDPSQESVPGLAA